MKKIFATIIALAALVSCNTEAVDEVVSTPQYLTTSLEVALDGDTRVFDNNLVWSWESTDEIAAYQVAGEQLVNTLSLKDNGKFGIDEFKYATNDSADFKFVYPAAALNADKSLGYVQTGEWTPTLVGIVNDATVNNIGTVEMKHMSAAFEIRVWDEGSNKDSKTPKNIKEATITSKTEGGVSASLTNLSTNTNTVVFNVAGGEDKDKKVVVYDIKLVDTNDRIYTISDKELTFVNGKRTILNVEWNNLALEGVNSWYNEVSNGVDSKLEAGAIYLNGLSGKDAVVYVDGNPATVSDNVIYGVASGEHTVYAAYKSNKTAEYAVTVTGKPSISYTATTSYNNNAGTVLKNNTLTNGNEGKLLTISNYSCNIAAEDAPYFGTPVFVYGNNEMAPANKSMELAVGQYNTYVKLPIVGTNHNLKYGEAAMYVTGIPYNYNFYKSNTGAVDAAGWTRNGSTGYKSDLLWIYHYAYDFFNPTKESGWVASPAIYSPSQNGLSTNITLVTKFYNAGTTTTMDVYVGASSSKTESAETTVTVQSKGSVDTSSTRGLNTANISLTVPMGEKYITISQNGKYSGVSTYFYLSSYKIEYIK